MATDLTALPALAEIVADPARADALPPDAALALLLRLHAVTWALSARVAAGLLRAAQADNPAPTRLLTAQEVAERLCLKPGHVYELARAGKLKGTRLGKYVRFAEADIAEYLAAMTAGNRVDMMLTSSREHDRRTVKAPPPRARRHASRTGEVAGRAYPDRQ